MAKQIRQFKFRVLGSILDGQRPIQISMNVHAANQGKAWERVGRKLDDSASEIEVREVRFIGEHKGSSNNAHITVY